MIFTNKRADAQAIADYLRDEILKWLERTTAEEMSQAMDSSSDNGEEEDEEDEFVVDWRQVRQREVVNAVRPYTAAIPTDDRKENMRLFKNGDCRILVCTEAASMFPFESRYVTDLL